MLAVVKICCPLIAQTVFRWLVAQLDLCLLFTHIIAILFIHSEGDCTSVDTLSLKLHSVLCCPCVCSSSKNQLQSLPMKIAIAGADSYIGSVLRPYVELLSSKSPEWLNFLRFLIIPFSK